MGTMTHRHTTEDFLYKHSAFQKLGVVSRRRRHDRAHCIVLMGYPERVHPIPNPRQPIQVTTTHHRHDNGLPQATRSRHGLHLDYDD